ncbi:MAG: GAF domain-containing protein [Sphingomonas sp.]|uniref:GAF domain-containing protein n=1 Tax=Sphingomonas sp. TaxID=28214 RepID=UPI002275326C|nr:GAF domain-containing protein [Sphingomonas sp.]MCX8474797.1 GAF domain-containing protein [Sphingomonas sp.]
MRERSHDHERLVHSIVQSPTSAATSPLAASWCRSALRHGLDPGHVRARTSVSEAELRQLHEANEPLLVVARPILDQLFATVGDSGCAVVLSDADGLILAARAGPADQDMFEEVGLIPGAIWSEAAEGTNGIGTCLAEKRAVTIHRDQHFACRNIGISCMDAPVYNPQGRLVAALDMSSCRNDHGEAMATLVGAVVRDAARRIEREFFQAAYSHARILVAPNHGMQGNALLAVDRDDIVIGASHAARVRYGLTDEALARPRTAADVLGQPEAPSFEEAERATLRQALAQARGNASEAARILGIGRATLYRRLQRHRLRPPA